MLWGGGCTGAQQTIKLQRRGGKRKKKQPSAEARAEDPALAAWKLVKTQTKNSKKEEKEEKVVEEKLRGGDYPGIPVMKAAELRLGRDGVALGTAADLEAK